MKSYKTSLFIFRRDLRLTDNTALNAALKASAQVLCCFIFDPRQIEPHPYQSIPALQFMRQALTDLQQQITAQGGELYFFNNRPEQLISSLQKELGIQAVFVNRDYTPFSRQRDTDLQQHCLRLGLDFHSHADVLLNEPEQILKKDGTPYQIFTAFYQRAKQNPVSLPEALAKGHFLNQKQTVMPGDFPKNFGPTNTTNAVGGRQAAMALLDRLPACRNYLQERDFPALSATSGLSPHLKFGCCSSREAYYAIQHSLGCEHALIRQLYWRDFFTHIAFHFPHVFGHAFHRRFDNIIWKNNQQQFWAWANGVTGFPIVDAAMRELKQTGCMHNRLRMVTASFLVKDLHISWRWGERYFAQHLVDYDPCVNNGNWQWAASTGCDAQPYFRIFNPWLQQLKFDSDCLYIKRWLPELREFSAKAIHQWRHHHQDCDYPAPIVNHDAQSRACKSLFLAVNG